MRRRPLCLLCLLFISVLCIADFFGVSFSSASGDAAEAEALFEDPAGVRVAGRVRSCKTQENTTFLILEDAWLTLLSKETLPAAKAPSPLPSALSAAASPGEMSLRGSFEASFRPLPLDGVRILLSDRSHFAVGTIVTASGMLSAVEAPTNPGQFDQKFYDSLQGIRWNLKKPRILSEAPSRDPFPKKALDTLREALSLLGQDMTDNIERFFPERAAGVLAAMITGDKSLLSEEARGLYRLGGISHILAISGLHITLLGVGVYRLLRKLRLPLLASGLLAAIFLILYAVLTGGSVATLRACIMFLLYLLSQTAFRVYDVPTALSVAAILLLLENPLYLFYAGFQLSFAAVLALTAFPGHGRFFSGLILYLITVPFTLWHYFSLPLYGVLVNLLVVPLLPFVLGFGLVGLLGSCLLSGLGLAVPGSLPVAILTTPAGWLLERIEHLLTFTKRLPFASLSLGRPSVWQLCLYAFLLFLFLRLLKLWRRTWRKYALLLALPLLFGVFFLRKTDGIVGLAVFLSVILPLLIVKGRFPRFFGGFPAADPVYASPTGVPGKDSEPVFRENAFTRRKLLGKGGEPVFRESSFTRRKLWEKAGASVSPPRICFGFFTAAFFLLAGIFLRPEGNLLLTFLDVGQGDGIVLDFPEGTVLVDGGSSSVSGVGKNRIEPFLACSGVRHLDYIAATHADADHISGIREILEDVRDHFANLSVGALLLPKGKAGSDALKDLEALARSSGIRVLYVSAGDFIEIGKARLFILGPDPAVEASPPDENAQCIVLGVHYGRFDALLTGDVQGEGEKSLLQKLREADEHRFDVLKVAHHGSRNSTPEDLLSLISPKLAVLSCGKNNSYGHPHAELLSRLRAAGSRIFRTDIHGAILVEVPSGETRFTVTPFLPDKEK